VNAENASSPSKSAIESTASDAWWKALLDVVAVEWVANAEQ
jgi:hypothetical protein